ncbi:MAG: ABC transporter permease [Clostridiaceae bacterium]|uniref:ABC transporter permease n=1 Tax=Clostridium porci TaxID=2605778 RepID=A0A7X2NMB8_9CLOT|nr:ABC transporter permease [Clostridium porci]MDY3230529.1 ABC transporter permease [Clostridiaceae bacterium]MSS37311.1 ABC transporter permease [Clostridium porci]
MERINLFEKRKGETTAKAVVRNISNYSLYILLLLMITFVSMVSEDFFTVDNFINLFRQISISGVAAIGMTFVMLIDEIDLSAGANAALAGVIACMLLKEEFGMLAGYGYFGILASVVIAVGISAVCGAACGILHTYLKIPSFIVTLGVSYIYKGIALLLTNAYPVIGMTEKFEVIGRGYIGGIPVPILIMVILYFIAWFILRYTKFGRSAYAIGGNAEAAQLSGIAVKRNKVLMFAIGGLTAGLAGVILASRMFSGQPTACANTGLEAIAAVTIGGTSAKAGRGRMWGTLLGSLIMGMISNALNIMKISPYYQFVALGAVLVIAVAIDKLKD